MAQIGANTLHRWATGEVVTADNMNNNQELLRTAINDTDTKITTHKTSGDHDVRYYQKTETYTKGELDAKINATTNTATVLSGTVFPTVATDGQMFWHKGLLALFTYDTTVGKWETAKAPHLPNLLDSNKVAFTRSSNAYQKNGTKVPMNVLRTEQGKYGPAAFLDDGTTNLLTENQSNIETNINGFTGATGGGTLATRTRDTSVAWEGTASLKVVGDGSGGTQGVYTDVRAPLTAGNTYTFSVRVKGTVGDRFFATIEEWSAATGGSNLGTTTGTTVTLTGGWDLLTVNATATTNGYAVCTVRHANINTAFTVWIDGLQLEQKAYATSFITGGQTRQPDSLSYTLSQPLPSKHFGCLVWKPDVDTSLTPRAFVLFMSEMMNSTGRHRLRYIRSDGFKLVKWIGDGTTFDSTPSIPMTAKQGDTFFVSWLDDQTTSTISLWVGKNGEALTKVSASSSTDYTDVYRVGIGGNVTSVTEQANGTIDFPIISSTIPTDEQVEALYRASELGGMRSYPNPTQSVSVNQNGDGVLPDGKMLVKPLSGGHKIQSGTATISITTANTWQSIVVTYPVAFTSPPRVTVQFAVESGSPSNNLARGDGIDAEGVTSSGFTLYVNCANTGAKTAHWTAIGT